MNVVTWLSRPADEAHGKPKPQEARAVTTEQLRALYIKCEMHERNTGQMLTCDVSEALTSGITVYDRANDDIVWHLVWDEKQRTWMV